MRIVLCYPVEPRHLRQIQEAAGDNEVVDAGQRRIAELLPTADVFCGHAKVPVPWAETVRAGRLRWIQSSAAGLDHCLTPEVIASDIDVASASGLFADQVAEQAMALLLGLVRCLPEFLDAQGRRQYERLPTHDLHGATVGILGLGGNGRRLVNVLQPWGVTILATDHFAGDPPEGVAQLLPAAAYREVLQVSDIVLLCVPLNSTTRHMIDRAALRSMKPDAILINVARGPVVERRGLGRRTS